MQTVGNAAAKATKELAMSSRNAPLAGDGEQGGGEASLKLVSTRMCC